MGIFFSRVEPPLPTINAAFKEAFLTDPKNIIDIDGEAAKQTVRVGQAVSSAVSSNFYGGRFAAAAVIAVALVLGAIWAGKHDLPDVSKSLMNLFSGFGGLVLGLLGGEKTAFS